MLDNLITHLQNFEKRKLTATAPFLSYCRELTSKSKELASKDPRSELGYRLSVQVDIHDPARPLAVVHVPSLGNKVQTTVCFQYYSSRIL